MAVKVIKCKCQSEFQDKLYGNQMRVHNFAGKPNTKDYGTKFICTVCKDKKS